ncbi:hypothetical protein [Aquimarina sp. 2304DJ70-9]|uniref:hypothetical protein n=1 Tax=Aquimarina penaris TaxID=3231044 RepID=UPI003462AB93
MKQDKTVDKKAFLFFGDVININCFYGKNMRIELVFHVGPGVIKTESGSYFKNRVLRKSIKPFLIWQ